MAKSYNLVVGETLRLEFYWVVKGSAQHDVPAVWTSCDGGQRRRPGGRRSVRMCAVAGVRCDAGRRRGGRLECAPWRASAVETPAYRRGAIMKRLLVVVGLVLALEAQAQADEATAVQAIKKLGGSGGPDEKQHGKPLTP